MAKGAYIGVSSVAKKIKKFYIGSGGIAHAVKKAYIGVGGVARLWWSGESLGKIYLTFKTSSSSSNTVYNYTTNNPEFTAASDFTQTTYPTTNVQDNNRIFYDSYNHRFIWLTCDSYGSNIYIYTCSETGTTWTYIGKLVTYIGCGSTNGLDTVRQFFIDNSTGHLLATSFRTEYNSSDNPQYRRIEIYDIAVSSSSITETNVNTIRSSWWSNGYTRGYGVRKVGPNYVYGNLIAYRGYREMYYASSISATPTSFRCTYDTLLGDDSYSPRDPANQLPFYYDEDGYYVYLDRKQSYYSNNMHQYLGISRATNIASFGLNPQGYPENAVLLKNNVTGYYYAIPLVYLNKKVILYAQSGSTATGIVYYAPVTATNTSTSLTAATSVGPLFAFASSIFTTDSVVYFCYDHSQTNYNPGTRACRIDTNNIAQYVDVVVNTIRPGNAMITAVGAKEQY